MRVLSLIHEDDAASGVFGDAVRARGDELVEVNVAKQGVPSANGYDAVFVFGGSMNVDQQDRHFWLRDEDALLKELLADGRPLLGVCLGSQLIAKAAGARVGPAREGEVGWREVELTPEAAGDPLLGLLPARFSAFQMHGYAFELAPGAVPLAANAACLQAYRIGESAWGIQFHAEVRKEDAALWLASNPANPQVDLAPMEGWNRIGRALAERFLDLAARRPRRARPAATRAR